MLSISQRLAQTQKLSPQQIQYQKLLQLNTIALEQRIKTELELNFLLEEELDLHQDTEEKESDIDSDSYGDDDFEESSGDNEFSLSDYMNDDEYFPEVPGKQSRDDESYAPVAPSRVSLSEHLMEQLSYLDVDDNLVRLGEEIIGNLDEDGYLKQDIRVLVDELRVLDQIDIPLEKAEWLLKSIQVFDPVGIASRNLKECLLVQLQNSSYDPYYSYLAEQMLKEHFEDFTLKRYDALRNKMQLSQETLRSVLDIIQRLNPKPGEGNITDAESNQIIPDFIIEKDNEDFIVSLNDRSLPSVTVSRTYLEMLQQNKGKRSQSPREKNTYKFLREKFESARWFIACIEQRRETLLKVMRSILERQYEFFDRGPKWLKPMIYKDVAEDINMDISTISRVVNGKYVQSPMGIHELKYFFSEGLSTESGEEVSNKQIKERIKEIIEEENKSQPLSDDSIADMLKEEGVHIARRTVAKYREQLRLPVARLRKEL